MFDLILQKDSSLYFEKKYPLRGCDYGMGASLTSTQARRRLIRWGSFVRCDGRPEALPFSQIQNLLKIRTFQVFIFKNGN
jgi:hypothetical protein